jgi:hypothetical protein
LVRIGLPHDPQAMMPWHSAEPSRGGRVSAYSLCCRMAYGLM